MLQVAQTVDRGRLREPHIIKATIGKSHVSFNSFCRCLLCVAMLSKIVNTQVKIDYLTQNREKYFYLWREIRQNTLFLKPGHY
jgi:hypothetical protein